MAAILKVPKAQVIETGFYPQFLRLMRSQFVKIDQFAMGISLALVPKRNGIFWGPGGYAKSEGMKFALHLVRENEGEAFIQSCDQSMTPERLFGGIDLNAMDDPTNKRIEFYLENSFLTGRFTVLEEGLDCPEVTITALKDTLTDKNFRNGKQTGRLMNESFFINTNKEPKQFITLGDTTKALIDRFVIQMRVAWDSHTQQDYLDLGRAVRNRPPLPEPGFLAKSLRDAQKLFESSDITDAEGVLSLLAEKAGQVGEPMSPRTYILAESVAKASAAMRGRNVVETLDLQALAFLPGIAAIDNLMQFIREADAADEANRLARHLCREYMSTRAELEANLAADQLDNVAEVQERLNALNKQIADSGMKDAVNKLMADEERRERARRESEQTA
jgi:MoxR-like ATPase